MARRARPRSALPHVAILALAATAGGMGCQFSPGSLSGNGDTPDARTVPGDAPPEPPDAPQPPDDAPQPPDASVLPPPDAGPAPDAAPLPNPNTLVSRGLLTRYLIDEDTDGTDTTTLDDSGPNPRLPLAINYDGEGEFIDDAGHRGLRWNAITTNGKAIADLAEDGKVWLGLDGSTTGTIEMVVDVAAFLSGSRLSHIGEDNDTGVFTLRIDEPESFAFAWNNADGGRVGWAVDVNALGRAVVHLVLDSRRSSPNERVRLYVNGVELTQISGSPPNLNEAIDIVTGSSTAYSIGNTEEGGRGVQATFYYASMYNTALDPGEVVHNYDILVDDDDGPGQ
jgi:hypothetical protein